MVLFNEALECFLSDPPKPSSLSFFCFCDYRSTDFWFLFLLTKLSIKKITAINSCAYVFAYVYCKSKNPFIYRYRIDLQTIYLNSFSFFLFFCQAKQAVGDRHSCRRRYPSTDVRVSNSNNFHPSQHLLLLPPLPLPRPTDDIDCVGFFACGRVRVCAFTLYTPTHHDASDRSAVFRGQPAAGGHNWMRNNLRARFGRSEVTSGTC